GNRETQRGGVMKNCPRCNRRFSDWFVWSDGSRYCFLCWFQSWRVGLKRELVVKPEQPTHAEGRTGEANRASHTAPAASGERRGPHITARRMRRGAPEGDRR